MKSIKFLVMAALIAFSVSACGFTSEVRKASAIVVPAATEQLTASTIVVNWMIDLLKARKQQAIDAYMEGNPEGDPSDIEVMIEMEGFGEESEMVPIHDIIDNLEQMSVNNMQIAVLLDTLNESVQANQGWNPIAGELETLAKDPEFQAMVRAYLDILRNKKEE
jgi:hypothetical protein